MLDTSAIAHSDSLSMAFMLYLQPKFQKKFLKAIYSSLLLLPNLIFEDQKNPATEIKRADRYFFPFWEVNFDMTVIEPSLERSTEICSIGSVLF